MAWDWNQCQVNLALQNEVLAGGRRAPCSTPFFLFLFLTLTPATSPFVLLVELFAQYYQENIGGLIQIGKKMGRSFCRCWFVFPDGSSLWCSLSCGHTHGTLGWYMGEKWSLGQLKFSWHWRWYHKPCYPDTRGVAITELRRCASELTLFPASKDNLHWCHWRRVWQQRAIIWWRVHPVWSSSHDVWCVKQKGRS